MKKEQYDYIENTLRELSLFIRNARIEEEKEEFRKQFFIVRDNTGAPLRNDTEDSQLNEKIGKLGINELFTEKEIKQMPRLKDLSYRYKSDVHLHEFRYRRNGHNKSFSSTDYKTAKAKALQFCKQLNLKESARIDKNITFNNFAIDYMQNVKRKNVAEKTFYNDYNRFENYILPNFKNLKIKEITAPFIQKFLNEVLDAGHQRTAEALFYIIKTILDYAVNTDVINKNPINAVKIPLHIRKTGKALTIEKEKQFVKDIIGNKYELTFAVLLYTGCRPCELESITIKDDDFIVFRNRKQKKNAIVYKNIPITPMLKPYVERIKRELPLNMTTEIGKIFAKLVPGYRLYDLRHTFATRCQTCGVPQEIVSRWLGHKTDKITDNTYTHFPKEFMLEQAKKVEY